MKYSRTAKKLEFEPRDYPAGGPDYFKVSDGQLSVWPYCFIARVIYVRGTSEYQVGTAWLMKNDVFVTAAHVCPLGHTFDVELPDGRRISVEQHHFHDYRGSPLSNGDLAVLHGLSGIEDGLAVACGDRGGVVEIAGYPRDHLGMYTHQGNSILKEDWFVHTAHTTIGQSGAPFILQNRVQGIHLGAAYELNSHAPGIYNGHPPGANAALAFNDIHLRFIRSFL